MCIGRRESGRDGILQGHFVVFVGIGGSMDV